MPRNNTSKSNPNAVKTAYASKGTIQYIEPPKKIKAHKQNKPKLIPRDKSIVTRTLTDIKKLAEKIYKEIDKLPIDQLTLLYEQINTMKKTIPYKDKAKSRYTLHYVQEKLSTSKGLWSESVIKDRKNRV